MSLLMEDGMEFDGTEFESLKKRIQEHKHLNHCEKCLAQEYCERLLEGIKNFEEEYTKHNKKERENK